MTKKTSQSHAVTFPIALCQTSDFSEITSRLTGATLIENLSDTLFLIPKHWSAKGVTTAVAEWKACPRTAGQIIPVWLQKYAEQLCQAHDIASFASAINQWISGEKQLLFVERTRAGTRKRMGELFVCLWRAKCICWPRLTGPLNELVVTSSSPAWGDLSPWIAETIPWFQTKSKLNTQARFHFFAQLILSRSPPANVCDICPGSPIENTPHRLKSAQSVLTTLLSLQKELAPTAVHYEAADFFGAQPTRSNRSDPEFHWVTQINGELADWRTEAATYMKTQRTGKEIRIRALNHWFQYLMLDQSLPLNPIALFDKNNAHFFRPLAVGCAWHNRVNKIIEDFLRHVMRTHCSHEDDKGLLYLPRNFGMPNIIPSPSRADKAYETHRQPMPTRFITLCAQILSEDNFSWAKHKSHTGGDWFKWRNPSTGIVEETWSPVRSYLLMLKLLLPARTFQLRALDSGEADSERYDPITGWAKNNGALAPRDARSLVANGAFRKFVRKDGTPGSLIFFNTNKTADIGVCAGKRGYVMAWERPEANQILSALRDWQEIHNPITQPTSWKDISSMKLRSEADLESMGDACFLFRDPTEKGRRDLPISNGKVDSLWLKLMDELEKRLQVDTTQSPTDTPIKIITKRGKKGEPVGALFDLHSLRVTIITSLYEQGVPAETIMKVVGHASVLMTLHYVKLRSEDINETLNEAQLRIQEKEQSNWIGYLTSQARSQLNSLTATNHVAGLDSLSKSGRAGIVTMDHGFCPLGMRRCSDGLVTRNNVTGSESYAPVPGAQSNCVSCRFFVTGPAFIGGLQAHFNDLSYRLKEQSVRFQRAQQNYDALTYQRNLAFSKNTIFEEDRAWQKSEATFERETIEVDGLALRMHATFRLVEQCLKIINANPRSNGFSLLTKNGGTQRITASLEETSELKQLQCICDAAGFYESVESEAPNLRRMRLFDQLLDEAGHPGLFHLIKDEKIARQAADEMARFLFARDRSGVIDALDAGEKTLEDLGIAQILPSLSSLKSTNGVRVIPISNRNTISNEGI